MNKKKQEFSFDEAFAELQNINIMLEQGNISVDELTEITQKAIGLIDKCKEKLYTAEAEINKLTEKEN